MEARASELPWSRERPWRRDTHVWRDRGVWVVDLHDLDAALTRRLVSGWRDDPPPDGGVVWVHGRGRRSGGRGPVLVHVLRDTLRGAGSLRPLGPGRTAWIVDDRAPGWLRGEWGCAVRALFALLLALAAVGLWAGLRG